MASPTYPPSWPRNLEHAEAGAARPAALAQAQASHRPLWELVHDSRPDVSEGAGEGREMGEEGREESKEAGGGPKGVGGRTVVAAVKQSSVEAEAVFEFLAERFNSPRCRVIFVHVTRPVEAPISPGGLFHAAGAEREAARANKCIAEEWAKKALLFGCLFASESRVAVGEPKHALQHLAETLSPPPHALVLGNSRSRRNHPGRKQLSSTSQHLVLHCPCRVVVVRPGPGLLGQLNRGPRNPLVKFVAHRSLKEQQGEEHN